MKTDFDINILKALKLIDTKKANNKQNIKIMSPFLFVLSHKCFRLKKDFA